MNSVGNDMTLRVIAAVLVPLCLIACQHKVQIVPSEKPIVINLNVKIDQEVRVRLDKDVEDLIENNPDLF